MLRRLLRAALSTRIWVALGVLAPLGMVVASATLLLQLRQDAWDKAEQTSANLLQVIERDITRNVEMIDLSLQAVVDNLKLPAMDGIDPALRQVVLFDRAAGARDMGVLLVIDENGDIAIDAGSLPPRTANYADRDYFLAHRAERDLGLFVGLPATSRLTGDLMLPFSRRIDKPDGSFGGVALGTLRLTYFSRLFDHLGLGRDGAINLYHRGGTRVVRYPHHQSDVGVNIGGTPNFDRFAREGRGSFVGNSVRDGIARLYTFSAVGTLPLILNVSLAVDEIEATWRAKGLVLGFLVLVLGSVAAALALVVGRELRQRAAIQVELARLSVTDALTGLPNRRCFDEALRLRWEELGQTGVPLSLLMIDVDHFKRFNDLLGHAAGDDVLRAIAGPLRSIAERSGGLACRYGGEEFAILLPGASQDRAMQVAREIHDGVRSLVADNPGQEAVAALTVSVGVACTETCSVDRASAITRLADEALYRAKAAGRNRTEPASLTRPVLPPSPISYAAHG